MARRESGETRGRERGLAGERGKSLNVETSLPPKRDHLEAVSGLPWDVLETFRGYSIDFSTFIYITTFEEHR